MIMQTQAFYLESFDGCVLKQKQKGTLWKTVLLEKPIIA
jgi:hypothetical protein